MYMEKKTPILITRTDSIHLFLFVSNNRNKTIYYMWRGVDQFNCLTSLGQRSITRSIYRYINTIWEVQKHQILHWLYTRMQKKRHSFTCSFLALTWLEKQKYGFVGKSLNFLNTCILIKFKWASKSVTFLLHVGKLSNPKRF